mgnify:CR=1 FL=1
MILSQNNGWNIGTYRTKWIKQRKYIYLIFIFSQFYAKVSDYRVVARTSSFSKFKTSILLPRGCHPWHGAPMNVKSDGHTTDSRNLPIDPTVNTPTVIATVIAPTVNSPKGNPSCCVIARNSSGSNRDGWQGTRRHGWRPLRHSDHLAFFRRTLGTRLGSKYKPYWNYI